RIQLLHKTRTMTNLRKSNVAARFDDCVHVHAPSSIICARKRAQITNDKLHALRCGVRLVHHRAQIRKVGFGAFWDDLARFHIGCDASGFLYVREDHRERVVDLVCEARGKRADGGDSSRCCEPAFELLASREITGEAEIATSLRTRDE